MIPPSIGEARNPGGLVSIVFDRDGRIIRESNLSPGVDVDAIAEADGEAFKAARPAVAALYDGDVGTVVATFRYDERGAPGELLGEFFGIPS